MNIAFYQCKIQGSTSTNFETRSRPIVRSKPVQTEVKGPWGQNPASRCQSDVLDQDQYENSDETRHFLGSKLGLVQWWTKGCPF